MIAGPMGQAGGTTESAKMVKGVENLNEYETESREAPARDKQSLEKASPAPAWRLERLSKRYLKAKSQFYEPHTPVRPTEAGRVEDINPADVYQAAVNFSSLTL
ncbi:uncharacterized protein N7529_009617 [Penicillium soppii]|uniref:uncharacterized protein n=1 Tax=Penicillium soppii TaxID=69789 RepID=UPI0025488331|nr:uncharacterized protein N7529_009617 [Penicillium soppii]KAJ5855673.1 hypothetical protein N7529_009617 [Penicillium soppii]